MHSETHLYPRTCTSTQTHKHTSTKTHTHKHTQTHARSSSLQFPVTFFFQNVTATQKNNKKELELIRGKDRKPTINSELNHSIASSIYSVVDGSGGHPDTCTSSTGNPTNSLAGFDGLTHGRDDQR